MNPSLKRVGAYTRSTADFYNAVESDGVVRKKTKQGIVIQGVRILSDFELPSCL